jgi:formamidopyrimidine-DNA glycosylase
VPELPELDVVVEVLRQRVVGQTIESATLYPPGSAIVVRDLTHRGFAQEIAGCRVDAVRRRGKFLLADLSGEAGPCFLAINPKLTGRLQLAARGEKRMPKTHLALRLQDGELRYVDQKAMGQVYLSAEPPERAAVVGLAELGPEPYEIGAGGFAERIRRFRGEIKNVLARGEFVAGIGNAYADEILWHAGIHPYTKRTALSREQVATLHASMVAVLREATDRARAEMGDDIHRKPRDFLNVHMKAGEPCPRCGATISLVGANQRITNFCRTCQPGGLFLGKR